jgi:hypothetical protein
MGLEFPEELIDDLAHGNTVIFVGSGVSAGCVDSQGKRPPTWDQLLLSICEGLPSDILEHIQDRIEKEDYLTASELAFRYVREDRLFTKLEEVFTRRYQPSDVHRALVSLGQRIYVTPNYDTILDTYFRSEFSEGIIVKDHTQRDLIAGVRSRSVLLIKSHGTIDDRDSIVLTRSHYARARAMNSTFYRILDSLFLTKTILFIGCGTKDPDIELLLEDACTSYPSAPPHYMIKLRSDDELAFDEAISRTRNVVMLYYERDHSQLPLYLDELVSRVDARRARF